jgi:hypothetical protein
LAEGVGLDGEEEEGGGMNAEGRVGGKAETIAQKAQSGSASGWEGVSRDIVSEHKSTRASRQFSRGL